MARQRLQARADRLSDGVKYIRLRQGCANEARAMAERAARLVDTEGPENAVRQFHDPKGGFRDRDLYIVVADRDDYFRAFGSDPGKAGKLRKEALPGDDQSAIRERSSSRCSIRLMPGSSARSCAALRARSRRSGTGLPVGPPQFPMEILAGHDIGGGLGPIHGG